MIKSRRTNSPEQSPFWSPSLTGMEEELRNLLLTQTSRLLLSNTLTSTSTASVHLC